MRGNLRAELHDGRAVIGTIARSASPGVCEALGYLGFDFLMLDAEHGALSAEVAEHAIRAAELGGAAPIMRVGENRPALITLALDLGAAGVHVPHVRSRSDAEEAVAAARYAPLGTRGFAAGHRGARFGTITPAELVQSANDEVLVVLHIEDRDGLEHLAEIARVPGVDVLFAAPFDLSQALGVPGEVDHPSVRSAVREVLAAAQGAGVVAGTYAPNPSVVPTWRAEGLRYLLVGSDLGFLMAQAKAALAQARGEETRA